MRNSLKRVQHNAYKIIKLRVTQIIYYLHYIPNNYYTAQK